ncbi:MAG: alpha/beta hydrolase [Chloroflexales bacterium]|nr:alpha/beta hydrolase [Chloroflexales bacterium]
MIDGLQHGYIQVNGIRMHYVAAGEGPPLLLLHGFPEFWYSWRHQIAALSRHFTVIAPDMRGYNETDKPNWGYEVDVLVSDMIELLHRFGYERAIVVGHDWGGAIAWALAITYPHRVERLIVLNCPHPALFTQALRSNPRQMLRSLYFGLFQLPWLPEALIRANDYALIDQIFRGQSIRKDAFSAEDIEMFKDAISKPGALTAALNWYRAVGRGGGLSLRRGVENRIETPTLLIWGEEDQALGKELTYNTDQFVSNLQVRYIPQCSHWVQQEQPELVNRYIIEFLDDLIEKERLIASDDQ